MKTRVFLLAGVVVALLLAGVVSSFASTKPDGLDSVLRDGCTHDAEGEITGGECVAQREVAQDGPFAGYAIPGIDNPYLSTGLAGAAGVLVTLVVGGGVFWLVRRRRT